MDSDFNKLKTVQVSLRRIQLVDNHYVVPYSGKTHSSELKQKYSPHEHHQETDGLTDKDKKSFRCGWCDKILSSLTDFTTHLNIHKGPNPHVCHICNARYRTKSQLVKHCSEHNGGNRYICSVCKKGFPTYKGYRHHFFRNHSSKYYHRCNICGKYIYGRYEYNLHVASHAGKKPFLCDKCGKTLLTSHSLKIHARNHLNRNDDVAAFTCEYCHRRFKTKYLCRDHVLARHLGMRRFLCDLCGHSFDTAIRLKLHLQLHAGERQYKRPSYYDRITGQTVYKGIRCRRRFNMKLKSEFIKQRYQFSSGSKRLRPCASLNAASEMLHRQESRSRLSDREKYEKTEITEGCEENAEKDDGLLQEQNYNSGNQRQNTPDKETCIKLMKYRFSKGVARKQVNVTNYKPQDADGFCIDRHKDVRELKDVFSQHTTFPVAKEVEQNSDTTTTVNVDLGTTKSNVRGVETNASDYCKRLSAHKDGRFSCEPENCTGKEFPAIVTRNGRNCKKYKTKSAIEDKRTKVGQVFHEKQKMASCDTLMSENKYQAHIPHNRYLCNMCDKAYMKLSSYEEHLKKHAEENCEKMEEINRKLALSVNLHMLGTKAIKRRGRSHKAKDKINKCSKTQKSRKTSKSITGYYCDVENDSQSKASTLFDAKSEQGQIEGGKPQKENRRKRLRNFSMNYDQTSLTSKYRKLHAEEHLKEPNEKEATADTWVSECELFSKDKLKYDPREENSDKGDLLSSKRNVKTISEIHVSVDLINVDIKTEPQDDLNVKKFPENHENVSESLMNIDTKSEPHDDSGSDTDHYCVEDFNISDDSSTANKSKTGKTHMKEETAIEQATDTSVIPEGESLQGRLSDLYQFKSDQSHMYTNKSLVFEDKRIGENVFADDRHKGYRKPRKQLKKNISKSSDSSTFETEDLEFKTSAEVSKAKIHSKNKKLKNVFQCHKILCSVCDKAFSYKASYEKHMLMHKQQAKQKTKYQKLKDTDNKTHSSNPQKFDQTAIDDQHTQNKITTGCETATGNKTTVKCYVCDKRFKYLTDFKLHLLLHTGSRPHVCDICGERFRLKFDLKRHRLNEHFDGKPHVCSICQKSFGKMNKLQRHFTVHTGERAYYCCGVCGKEYTVASSLVEHMQKHMCRITLNM